MTDAEAETPILWPPHVKSWLIGKDSTAGKDWGQEEKGTTEDEMAGWDHWLDGHGFGCTPGVGDGQGGLVFCGSWGHSVGHDWVTELNWTDMIRKVSLFRQSLLTLELSDNTTWQNVSLGLEFLQKAVSGEGQIDPLTPGRLEYTQYLNWLSHLILSWGREGQNHSLLDSYGWDKRPKTLDAKKWWIAKIGKNSYISNVTSNILRLILMWFLVMFQQNQFLYSITSKAYFARTTYISNIKRQQFAIF